ncbi:MAG: phage tail sheath family protein [Sedimentisphaerales bacterium]|nr:phage tail sheath family protein [Sedimentisphaerales bacterium]
MPEYKHPGIYIEEIPSGNKSIEGLSTNCVAFVGTAAYEDVPVGEPTPITSWGQFVEKLGRFEKDKAPFLPPAVSGFFINGEKKCYVVRVKASPANVDYIGNPKSSRTKTGLSALSDIEGVSIICIPGITANIVQSAMLEHCRKMGNRFCILDPPAKADVAAVKKFRSNLVSEDGYGALYYPWIKTSIETAENDNITYIQDFVPPSGYVAGIYAKIDDERGVWKAPAGVEVDIKGAAEVELDLPAKARDELNQAGINCIRNFGQGIIKVWGARTLALNNQWKYVNVRRLCIFLEESIKEATRWVVFEPNDEPLWTKVKSRINSFLRNLWRLGAFMGSTSEKAFFVKCGLSTTMLQFDIDTGRVIIEIGIAPLRPAEFIILRIIHCSRQTAS